MWDVERMGRDVASAKEPAAGTLVDT
jgi:hypothetical protein